MLWRPDLTTTWQPPHSTPELASPRTALRWPYEATYTDSRPSPAASGAPKHATVSETPRHRGRQHGSYVLCLQEEIQGKGGEASGGLHQVAAHKDDTPRLSIAQGRDGQHMSTKLFPEERRMGEEAKLK